MKSIFVILLFASAFLSCRGRIQNDTYGNLTPIDYLRVHLLDLESELWTNLSNPRWNEAAAKTGADIEVAKSFHKFGERLDDVFARNRSTGVSEMENVWLWAKISSSLQSVDQLYEAFRIFLAKQTSSQGVVSPIQAWLDLSETILFDPTHSVQAAFKRVHEWMVHGNLFSQVLKESQSDLCNLKQSSQQLLYNMYITISLTEIKGYTMMQFSWMLLKIYGKGNFTQEANLMRNRYEERTSLTVASIKSAMANAKRDMWRCDPSYYEEGETYTSITQLLQGYIENEVDMNSEGTCKENCVYYTLTKNHGCFKDQYCARQAACSGRIISCQYIDSDMSICPATRNTGRRYEWIEYENGRTLGRPGSCMRQTAKVDSWWRWNLLHCSYCLCLCEENGPLSDRYFSLRTVLSDVAVNKVVTGIRFIKKNRIIHLQINEGTLLPRANIDPMSVHWKSIENMDIRNSSLVSGVDYHTLTYEKRAIDLDDLEGPTETVLTGVRFSMVGPHLHFEIRVTPFNYSTGNLQAERSVWISNDNTDGAALSPRTKKELYKPDIPSRSNTPSVPDTTSDQYMEFTHSDYDADAAQTTVPFIDIQPVMPSTPLPLVGAGIFHKGQKGYGGFFAPKVFTYDYSKHMQAVFPPINKPLIQ